ncbi:methionine-R-sulfoxide reductase [Clostridiales Family XIII bacterium PM5-7]
MKNNQQRPSAEQAKARLNEEQYRVTQENGTEPPFINEFWDKFDRGIYVDVVSGEPLFVSTDKYTSNCGWPAFAKPISEQNIVLQEDTSHGMVRTEVRSQGGNSHLGHVFDGDAESPTGIRYCINSASLRFIPFDKMDEEGYSEFKKLIK